jgi:hypothetical protein
VTQVPPLAQLAALPQRKQTSLCGRKFFLIPALVDYLPASLWKVPLFVPITEPTKICTERVSAKSIVFKKAVPAPESAKELLATLEKVSPKNKSKN